MPQMRHPFIQFIIRPEIIAALLLPIFTLALMAYPCEPIRFPDNYLEWAKGSLFSYEFWFQSRRPPTTMLLYKFCRYDLNTAVFAQQIISVFSWLVLGVSIARNHPSRLGALFVPIFGIAALCYNLSAWSFAILTESISFSLFALFLAIYMQARKKGSKLWIVGLVIVTILFSLTRDQISYYLLSFFWLALPFELFLRKEDQRKWLIPAFALGFCVLFLIQNKIASNMGRHVFPFKNVLLQRILPQEEFTNWFLEQGAPLNLLIEDERDWRGMWGSSHEWALDLDPKFRPFNSWAREEAKGPYARFLLSHPNYTIRSAFDARLKIYSYDLDYVKKTETPKIMEYADFLWRPSLDQPKAAALMGTIFLIYLVLLVPARLDPLALVISLCAVGNGIFAFHADAMEVPRHCVFTGIALQVSFWLALASLSVALATRLLKRSETTAVE